MKYNRGSGRKRTNEKYGLRSASSTRRVVLWHFFVQLFMHFVDYRGRIFFAELLQKPLGMTTHLWLVLSAPSRLPLCVSLRQLTLSGFLFQLPLSGFLCQLPSGFSRTCLSSLASGLVGDLEFKPFIWFRTKTDKGIVCLAGYPYSVSCVKIKVLIKYSNTWNHLTVCR